MITEDYVSFEIAKLLKEKGFDEPCGSAYTPEGQYRLSCYLGPVHRKIRNSEASEYSYGPTAPTLQMVMKWLREVHKIDMWVEGYNRRYKGYIHSEQRGDEALFYEDSYEKACEVTIKYCLENLI